MVDCVTLTCPSCGSKLQVGKDLETFACGHCGNELVVKRGGGIVSLAPVVEGLRKVELGVAGVRQGVDRTAAELAVARLVREIDEISAQYDSITARHASERDAQSKAYGDSEKARRRKIMWRTVLAIFCIFVGVIGTPDNPGGMLFWLLIGAASAFAAFVAYRGPSSRRMVDVQLSEECQRLSALLAKKREQLATNRVLLDGAP